MKLSKLFVLAAAGLVSLTANAADLNERTTPEAPDGVVDISAIDKTPVDYEIGKVYVMYNTGAQMYYYRGNAWTTQASGSESNALLVRFVSSGTGNTVWLRDYDDRGDQLKWRTAFITTTDSKASSLGLPAALFIDNNDGGAALMTVTSMGEKVYRVSVAEENTATKAANITTAGTYIAIDPSLSYADDGMGGNAIDPVATEGNIDWQFFVAPGAAEWESYFNALDVYNRSQDLKAMIERAEEASVDVSAAVDVYNNEGSTLAQIEAAIAALQEAIASSVDFSGTAENPSDVTSLIENPNFDGHSAAGWSGSAPGWGVSGQEAAEVPEFWQATFDTYQDLGGMVPGVYRLDMNGFYRSGGSGEAFTSYTNGENYIVKLYADADGGKLTTNVMNPFDIQNKTSYAGDKEWGVGASESGAGGFLIPNDPSCARAYFEEGGFYLNTLFFYVGADKTARVGVFKDGAAITNDWFAFDNFKLQYFGNTAESFGKWVELSVPSFEGVMVTTSLLEDYNTMVSNSAKSATNKETALSALEPLKEKAKELNTNSALWAKWLAAIDDAKQYTTGDYSGLTAAATLDEYIGWEADEQINAPTWTNDEIQASIDKIAEMVEAVKIEKMSQIEVGEDVTALYIGEDDATFKNGKGSWSLEGNCNFGAGGAEAYNQVFDLYKEIASVNAAGVYELKLNGFFRLERDQTAYDMFTRGEQDATRAWIYMNDVKSYVQCVFTESVPDGVFPNGDPAADGQYWVEGNTNNWYANTMTSAVECFDHEMYQVKAYGLVANAGDPLRIGIAGNMTGNNWMMWDNFKLTYVGYDAATIQPILEEAIANMPSLDDPMGKSVYEKAIAAKTAAENPGSDGKAMFETLKTIWEVSAEIPNSVALFKSVTTAAEALNELISSSSNEDAINEAGEFNEKLSSDLADHKYEDSDVPELLKQIQALRCKLKMPAVINDGDDLTVVVETPNFDDGEGSNSVAGWNAEGYNFGNDETQRSALALEFYNKKFDLNQTIYGLPNGKYTVKVYAFQRCLEENPTYLYANSATKALKKLENYSEAVTEAGLEEVGSMVTASAAFEAGFFRNQIVATVTDGTLTIGIKKETNNTTTTNEETGETTTTEGTTDWVIMDTWTLTAGEHLDADDEPANTADTNGDGAVDVADISSVITAMAAGSSDAQYDVNRDGAVDVADISAIITEMAKLARAAKAIEE